MLIKKMKKHQKLPTILVVVFAVLVASVIMYLLSPEEKDNGGWVEVTEPFVGCVEYAYPAVAQYDADGILYWDVDVSSENMTSMIVEGTAHANPSDPTFVGERTKIYSLQCVTKDYYG